MIYEFWIKGPNYLKQILHELVFPFLSFFWNNILMYAYVYTLIFLFCVIINAFQVTGNLEIDSGTYYTLYYCKMVYLFYSYLPCLYMCFAYLPFISVLISSSNDLIRIIVLCWLQYPYFWRVREYETSFRNTHHIYENNMKKIHWDQTIKNHDTWEAYRCNYNYYQTTNSVVFISFFSRVIRYPTERGNDVECISSFSWHMSMSACIRVCY